MNTTVSRAIRKILCYYLLFSVFFCIQTVFAKDIAVFSIAPYFMPCMIVCIACLDAPAVAISFALVSGVVSDAFAARSTSYYTIAFLVLVALLTILIKDIFRRSFFSSVALSFGATFLVSLMNYVIFYGIFSLAGIETIFTVVLPEAFYSTLFIVLIYPLVAWIERVTR